MRNLNAPYNIAFVRDGVSGDVHELHYRMPTNAERISYQAGLYVRRGKQLINQALDTRLRLGSQLLVGFAKGTIGLDGKPFAADPKDPDYREDWRNLLLLYAPDVVAVVALAAFEGTGVVEAPAPLPLDLGE